MKNKIMALALSLTVLAFNALPAMAVRTALTVKTPANVNSTIAANGADVTFTAADVSNGNSFISTGRELVLVQNTGGSDYTVTITSAPDELGRTGDISAYTLATTEFAAFGPVQQKGWVQPDGKVYLSGSNAGIKFLILRLP